MFLTFSQIFSASKQIYYQIQQNPDSSKPKFSIPNKKKFIKLEINPKSENNKIRTTHTTTTTTRKSEIKESKRIGDKINPKQADRQFSGKISGLTNGATISGFATISGEWVWRFLGSRLSVANGFDDFWVHDDRCQMGLTIFGFAIWGMGSTAQSLSLCVCASESLLLSLSLSLWALLDERAWSWVFWVRRSSWMWIDLAFTGAGVLVWSLFLAVSLSLFYFPGVEVIWSENENGNYFPPSQPYFMIKLKTFSVWPNFQ